MFRDVLSTVDGITLLPILAMLIFIALFVMMLIWVIRLGRDYIDKVKNIPLDEDPPPPDEEPMPSSGESKSSSEESAGLDSEKANAQTGRSNQKHITNRNQE